MGAPAGQITVHAATGDSSMQIDDVQRLSQLLTHPGLNTWWPGTVIAERGATAAVQQQRHQLLTDLRAWQLDGEPEPHLAEHVLDRQPRRHGAADAADACR
ncbi:hypothetical protein CRX72_06100 [Pantoea sp. BRM17]|nr:hypothetical protein CRX72_06100 [Pantoea sp. BRM17]